MMQLQGNQQGTAPAPHPDPTPTAATRSWRRGMKQFFPWNLQKEPTLRTTLDSALQNCERINLCCLKTRSLLL